MTARCILRLKDQAELRTYVASKPVERIRREINPARPLAKAFADQLANDHGPEEALDALDGARVHLASAVSQKAVQGLRQAPDPSEAEALFSLQETRRP